MESGACATLCGTCALYTPGPAAAASDACEPGHDAGAWITSSTGSSCVASFRCPAMTTIPSGRALPSAQRWILIVRPPREWPIHSSLRALFFPPCRGLACSRRGAVCLDVRRIQRGAVPVRIASCVGPGLLGLEEAQPGAVSAPAHEAIVTGLTWSVPLRDIAPGSTRAEPLEDTVDHLAVVALRTAPSRSHPADEARASATGLRSGQCVPCAFIQHNPPVRHPPSEWPPGS